jgi:dTDP-glucose pyrophosphorylase
MADIINLNKARKAKTKQSKMAQAVENRIRYGVATMDRKVEKAKQKQEAQKLDNHLLGTHSHNKKVDAPQ